MISRQFYEVMVKTEHYSYYLIWSITFFALLLYWVFVLLTSNKHNWRLVLILMMMTVTTLTKFFYAVIVDFFPDSINVEYTVYALSTSTDILVHWIFCEIYLKLAIEVKYLLDNRIYSDNSGLILDFNRENCCLRTANFSNIVICLILVVYPIIANTVMSATICYAARIAL